MNPRDLVMLCTCIVHAGALSGQFTVEDAQDHSIHFVSQLAEALAELEQKIAEDGPDHEQIRRETRP